MRTLMSIHIHTGQPCGRGRRTGTRSGGASRRHAAQYIPLLLNIHSYPLSGEKHERKKVKKFHHLLYIAKCYQFDHKFM